MGFGHGLHLFIYFWANLIQTSNISGCIRPASDSSPLDSPCNAYRQVSRAQISRQRILAIHWSAASLYCDLEPLRHSLAVFDPVLRGHPRYSYGEPFDPISCFKLLDGIRNVCNLLLRSSLASDSCLLGNRSGSHPAHSVRRQSDLLVSSLTKMNAHS